MEAELKLLNGEGGDCPNDWQELEGLMSRRQVLLVISLWLYRWPSETCFKTRKCIIERREKQAHKVCQSAAGAQVLCRQPDHRGRAGVCTMHIFRTIFMLWIPHLMALQCGVPASKKAKRISIRTGFCFADAVQGACDPDEAVQAACKGSARGGNPCQTGHDQHNNPGNPLLHHMVFTDDTHESPSVEATSSYQPSQQVFVPIADAAGERRGV